MILQPPAVAFETALFKRVMSDQKPVSVQTDRLPGDFVETGEGQHSTAAQGDETAGHFSGNPARGSHLVEVDLPHVTPIQSASPRLRRNMPVIAGQYVDVISNLGKVMHRPDYLIQAYGAMLPRDDLTQWKGVDQVIPSTHLQVFLIEVVPNMKKHHTTGSGNPETLIDDGLMVIDVPLVPWAILLPSGIKVLEQVIVIAGCCGDDGFGVGVRQRFQHAEVVPKDICIMRGRHTRCRVRLPRGLQVDCRHVLVSLALLDALDNSAVNPILRRQPGIRLRRVANLPHLVIG